MRECDEMESMLMEKLCYEYILEFSYICIMNCF